MGRLWVRRAGFDSGVLFLPLGFSFDVLLAYALIQLLIEVVIGWRGVKTDVNSKGDTTLECPTLEYTFRTGNLGSPFVGV